MALYLARHGETDWNAAHRLQARSDVPLNDTGRRQARCLGETLRTRGLRFVLARSSPLQRARETLAIALAGSDVPREVEPAFVELSLGEYEGRLESELRAELGHAYDRWRSALFTRAAPGGEDMSAALARVSPALLALRPVALRGHVLVVGHQAVNVAIAAAIGGHTDVETLARYRQANDEVDVWDLACAQRIERIRLAAEGGEGGGPHGDGT